MGELINLNPLTITDADIPQAIARDSETTAAINAHITEMHGVRTVVVTGVLPSAQNAATVIPLPTGVTPDKVVALSAICRRGSPGTYLYLPPTDKLPTAVGHRYYVYMDTIQINCSVGSTTESQLVFGATVKIVISYLP